MMDRSIQRTCNMATWSLLVLAIIIEFTARETGIAAAHVAALIAGIGFLGSAMIQFVLRVYKTESEALEEFEKIQQEEAISGEQNLFQTSEENIQSRQVRKQIEKWGIPGISIIIFIIQVAFVFLLWKDLGKGGEWESSVKSIGLSIFGVITLVAFLLGKFVAGLARGQSEKWLRFGASQLIWISLVSFLICSMIIADWAGFQGLDAYFTRFLLIIILVNALEIVGGLVFEIYRPKKAGDGVRFFFESRLLSFLSHPGGFFATAAQAIDYQFGFKVSETWFYKYLEKALGWIILVQLLLFWGSSSILVLEPEEQAIIEKWGKSRNKDKGILNPGLYFKLPWPFEKVYRYNSGSVRRIVLGPPLDPEVEKTPARLWTQNSSMYDEFILVASGDDSTINDNSQGSVPVNLLSARIPIQYIINDISKWALGHHQPEELLSHLAQREVSNYFLNQDFDYVLFKGRQEASVKLKENIQSASNKFELGIEIIHVSLHALQPPTYIAAEFEEVIAAEQLKQTKILNAESYASGLVPLARAEATNLIQEAEGRKLSMISEARGISEAFRNRLKAYNEAPEVYRKRTHMQALTEGLSDVRTFLVLSTNRSKNIEINFEQRIDQSLLNIDLDKNKSPNRDTSK